MIFSANNDETVFTKDEISDKNASFIPPFLIACIASLALVIIVVRKHFYIVFNEKFYTFVAKHFIAINCF